MEMTRSTGSWLKSSARGLLLGKYNTAIRVYLIYNIIQVLISAICSSVVDPYSAMGMLIYGLIAMVVLLFYSVFDLGVACFYLKMATGVDYGVKDLFMGFKGHADKVIRVRFLLMVLTCLPLIPGLMAVAALVHLQEPRYLLIAAIVLPIGLVWSIHLNLRFSQVYYLMLDFPHMTTMEVLAASVRLMQGNKLRLLGLYISFIPMYILGIASMGLASLWIDPYMRATYTYFYLDAVRGKQ